MKYIFTVAFVFLFSYACVYAQVDLNNKLFTVIPPSPDASSLGKYGSIPVDYSTGTPAISVPIYTIKESNLEIPISVSYHANGIKVEEMASWVGLGWSLNAGGVVTRSVVGLPDESQFGYFYQPYDIDTLPQSSSTTLQNISNLVNQGQLDLEPDVYYFNFLGKSGKFFVDRNLNVKVIPIDINIKVSLIINSNIITGWKIIDPQGNTYFFRTSEATHVVRGSATKLATPPMPVFNSSWYLDQVITSLNDTINFSYQTYSCHYYSRQMAYKYYLETSNSSCTVPGTEAHYYDSTTISGKRIAEIDFRGGKVLFNKGAANRTDIVNDYTLSNIAVYNNFNTLIRQCNFSYSYFQSGQLLPTILPPSYTNTRLRLDSMQMDTSGYPLQYKFTYNNLILPSLFSYAEDHWGYYNGKNNFNMIPLAQVGTSQLTDRSVDTGMAKAGILTRIAYPTGGTTDFIYEGNTATITKSQYDTYFMPYGAASSNDLVSYGAIVRASSPRTDTFYVDPSTTTFDLLGDNFHISVYTNNNNSCTIPSKTCIGTIWADVYCISDTSIPPITHIETRPTYTNGTGSGGVMQLDTGQTYVLVLHPGDPGSIVSIGATKEVMPASTPSGLLSVFVGGLRIAKIVNTPGNGIPETKEYYYSDSLDYIRGVSDNTVGSGVLNTFPTYSFTQSFLYMYSDQTGDVLYTCQYAVRASSSLTSLVSSGSAVNYKTVQENTVSNVGRLKTVYKYTTSADYADAIVYSYPYILTYSNQFKRGLLEEESSYNNTSGNNFALIRKKDYQYRMASDTAIPGFKITCLGISSLETGGCTATSYNTYYQSSDWISKIVETSTDYIDASDSVVTSNYYYYDNPLHNLPTRIQTANSKGETEISYLRYPLDFNISEATSSLAMGISNLQNKNVVTPVIENYVQLQNPDGSNSRVISAKLLSYPPSVASPDTIWTAAFPAAVTSFAPAGFNGSNVIKNNQYTPQIMCVKYGSYGNVSQVYKVSGINTSYLWDYNALYPIAEVENADSASIAYTSFEADGTGNWTVPDTSRNRTTFITGKYAYNLNSGNTISCSGLNSAKTYLVSYWSQNGSLNVNGSTAVKGNTLGSWTYYEHQVSGTTSISVSGSATIDELRLFPKGALMKTYCYAPLIGVISQCSANNIIVYYDYDWQGRLMDIKDQNGNVLKTIEYHYENQP